MTAAFLAVLMICHPFALADSSGTRGTTRTSGYFHEDCLKWEDALLAARIFLGKLPDKMPGADLDSPELVALGQMLYFEHEISINRSQACNDCHFLTQERAGADVTPTSNGATGISGKRNSPTVINAGFQFSQFWDGRAGDLNEQARAPLLNRIGMAIKTEQEVIDRLQKIDKYPVAFEKAFPGDPDPISFDHITQSIAAFERTLVAPSRLDRLFAGDPSAMTDREKNGLTKFIIFNCVECHTGSTVGGQLFRKIGQRNPYANTSDSGRYEVTRREEDRFVFKVPMLRNVTRTPPYFHDGQIFTLEDAVAKMGWHQLDLQFEPGDIVDLIAFLNTLEGDPPFLGAAVTP